jgi:hypothetical protein
MSATQIRCSRDALIDTLAVAVGALDVAREEGKLPPDTAALVEAAAGLLTDLNALIER